MYSPQTTVEAARKFTTDASGNPGAITQAITRYGLVGHAQASAQARRHNRPVIIRRDFDTVDGGYAGLHFVSRTALDSGFRSDPQRDERDRRPQRQPEDHGNRQ